MDCECLGLFQSFRVSEFGFAELAGVYPARQGLGSEFHSFIVSEFQSFRVSVNSEQSLEFVHIKPYKP